MILINLLPHREEKRRQRKRAFFATLAACAVLGLVVAGIWYAVLQQMTSAQQARNDFLKAEISRLELQIKDIATLRAEIEALKARQKAVEGLQTDRNIPVHLLDELVKQTPEGIYLTSVKQNGPVVLVTGMAQTNERVSEFLRNTLYNSPWLEKPELVEIKTTASAPGAAAAASRDQRRLNEFSMRLSLKRPQAPAAALRRPPLPPAPQQRSLREYAMNAKTSNSSFDVSGLAEQAVSQFRGLNPKEPGQWPALPKVASWLATVVAVVVACWFGLLSDATDELQAERDREPALKKDYVSKLGQAVNLGELRKQKLQVQEYVTQLEKQLAGQGRDGRAAVRHQPGRARARAAVRAVPSRPGRGQGLLRRAADRHQGQRSLSTTWAPSPPTWPTCRASSRCTTCRSPQ